MLSSRIRICGLALIALTCLSLRAASAPPVTLTASGSNYSLITSGAGEKTVRVLFPSASGISSIKTEVFASDLRVNIEEHPCCTRTTAVPATGGDQVISTSVSITLPHLGLYAITFTALDASGRPLATTSISYAAVPPRKEVGPSDFGVATHLGRSPADIDHTLDLIKLAGFSRLRDEVPWNTVERKPGVFTFPPQDDAFIKEAVARGLSPLVILDYGNAKVYPAEFAGTKGFPEGSAARGLFVRYATELVKRYGSLVKTWEVWNEPQSWGKPPIENYTLLLKAVYAAVKGIDSSAYVIGCGGGGAGGGPGGDYVGGVVGHGGLDSMDGFSIHPYITPPGTPEFGYGAIDAPVPRVNIPMLSAHLGGFIDHHPRSDGKKLDLWVTEFGTVTSPVSFVKGEPFQALFLTRSYLLSRRYGRIKASFWYDFMDDGINPRNPEHNFGLIRHDFSPKPAYVAAAVLTNTLGDRPWKRAIVEKNPVWVEQFGDDNDAVIVGWASQDLLGDFVMLHLKPGKYTLRDWQGIDKTIEIDPKGYRWKVDALPQYLIPQG